MRPFTTCTRLALIALSTCAIATGEVAHADAPQAGTVPPGWVWQGVWQDGRWSGQWIPGGAPGTPAPGAFVPPPPGMPGAPPAPFPAPGYPPVGYIMVPMPAGQQAPCVETKTVTTEYVANKRSRLIRAKPHHKDKRVYTGS